MKHNSQLTSVDQAKKIILKHIEEMPSEEVHILDSFGRIIDKPIFSKLNNPPSNVSSMDGYAITENDLMNKTKKLKCIGVNQAGQKNTYKIKKGETVRVFTGAEIPKGTKTIIIQENTIKHSIKSDHVNINHSPNSNTFIRKRGMDFKKSDLLFLPGYQLNARAISLAASAGNSWLSVKQKPKIAILSSGDELIRPGDYNKDLFNDNKIFSSNSIFLYFFIKKFGGNPIILPTAKDEINSIKSSLQNNKNYDLIVSSGGASVGKYDLIKDTLLKNDGNFILDFWKIAMRPGKPLFFGRLNKTPFLGLPGNPVSTGVCAIIFLKLIIEKFLNQNILLDYRYSYLEKDLKKNDEREDYIRAITTFKNNQEYVKPFDYQDSGQLNIFSKSNCFIVRKPKAKFCPKGSFVKIIKIPSLI